MTLDDLIVRIYRAHDSFSSIHLRWQYQYDIKAIQFLMNPLNQQNDSESITEQRNPDLEASDTQKFTYELWFKQPNYYRYITKTQRGDTSTTIHCDGDWWAFYTPSGLVQTNVRDTKNMKLEGFKAPVYMDAPDPDDFDIPLLDPSFLLMSHDLKIIDTAQYLDRDVVQVHAYYRKRKYWLRDNFFWATADDYDLLFEKKYGVLFRYAARINATDIAVMSVNEVSFDLDIDDAIFRLSSRSY